MVASRSTLVLASLTLLTFLAGFESNHWRVADAPFFAGNQKDTEALVIGRMALSRRRSPLAGGGLLGFVGEGPAKITFDTSQLWQMQSFAYQTEAYMHGAPIRSFSPYFTHGGLQGLGFAALDALTPLAPSRWERRWCFERPRTRCSCSDGRRGSSTRRPRMGHDRALPPRSSRAGPVRQAPFRLR